MRTMPHTPTASCQHVPPSSGLPITGCATPAASEAGTHVANTTITATAMRHVLPAPCAQAIAGTSWCRAPFYDCHNAWLYAIPRCYWSENVHSGATRLGQLLGRVLRWAAALCHSHNRQHVFRHARVLVHAVGCRPSVPDTSTLLNPPRGYGLSCAAHTHRVMKGSCWRCCFVCCALG